MQIESAEDVVSRSAEDTLDFGRRVAQTLDAGSAVFLTGSLGAGKSVLARGIAEGLGMRDWRGSPTFALVHEYPTTPRLYHLDLYRLTETEIEELGLEEYISPNTIALVEWADRARTYLHELASGTEIWIDLWLTGPEERIIELKRPAL